MTAQSDGGDQRHEPICVVDDDASVCDSLSAVLGAYGYTVLIYANGAAFLADQDRHRTGILVIDQHMPEMDGLAVIATLQREGTVVPTILTTGRLDAGITERARQLGVLAVLEKPFSALRLVDLVQTGLDRRG